MKVWFKKINFGILLTLLLTLFVGARLASAQTAQTPYGGLVRTLDSKIEAEDLDEGGQGVAFNDTTPTTSEATALGEAASYRSPIGIDLKQTNATTVAIGFTRAGEWAEYTLRNNTAANYNLTVRGGAVASGKQLQFSWNGTNIATVNMPVIADWYTYQEVTVNNIAIPAGQGVLRITWPADHADIDWFKFTPSNGQTPYGGIARVLDGKIEAEHFDEGGQDVAFNDSTPGTSDAESMMEATTLRYSGVDLKQTNASTVAIGFGKAGEWVEYTLVSPRATTYNLTLNGGAIRSGKQLQFSWNGNNIATVNMPVIADWYTYQETTVSNISVPAGQGILRITWPADHADIDWFRFTPSAGQTAYGGTPQSLAGKIEAESFDEGGQDLAFHDTTPLYNEAVNSSSPVSTFRVSGVDIKKVAADNSDIVGFAKAGEWIEYTLTNPSNGSFTLTLRGGSIHAGRQLQLSWNGEVIATFETPVIPNWNSHTTMTKQGIVIPAGTGVLRITWLHDHNDIDWFQFAKEECKVDYSGDGKVDIFDFQQFAQFYRVPNQCELDLIGDDCILDIADFSVFASFYRGKAACVLD